MHHSGSNHRVTAEIEKVVMRADGLDTQHFLPDLGQLYLRHVARSNEGL
jgi:hypothetical protein